MRRKSKADLEQLIMLQLETIELQERRINELQDQLMQKIEASSIYQQAIIDARIAQEIADMYKNLYEQVS
ncbi:MAG: hypothetical protein IKE31_11395 [Eubacterium sp.]|nr:hypothetical protein [Eubacterium sp.]